MICPASGAGAPTQPDRCDDTAYGKGTGGRLTYQLSVPAGGRTVWFSVAGSDDGVAEARSAQSAALRNPAALLRAKRAQRAAVAEAHAGRSCPATGCSSSSVTWSKQNLADSVQEARNLQVRVTNAGTKYPAPVGTVAKARWIGAGWPDYPWLFATDGEYTGFAAVASGQFAAIEDHLRALRDVSLVANGTSGKVVHEVTPDGQVYFGANDDAGNTDETAKFPSLVALVWRWTGDDAFRDDDVRLRGAATCATSSASSTPTSDGWPEGLGNVERSGMGEEKLDNTVYTIRGLRDLADLAASKGDTATRPVGDQQGRRPRGALRQGLVVRPDRPAVRRLARRPGQQAGLPAALDRGHPGRGRDHPSGPGRRSARPDRPTRGRWSRSARRPATRAPTGCSTPAPVRRRATDGNPGATCDSATSSVQAERSVFTLNTSIMAVAEAALGRMAPSQLRRYTTDNARVQLDPQGVGAARRDAGDRALAGLRPANIDRLFTERSMALQAWGTYGILWPVVHYQLGVSPDVGRDRFTVVPQIPSGQYKVAGRDIRHRSRPGQRHRDPRQRPAGHHRHSRTVAPHLTIGALLPTGAKVSKVTLDGHRVSYRVVHHRPGPRGPRRRGPRGRVAPRWWSATADRVPRGPVRADARAGPRRLTRRATVRRARARAGAARGRRRTTCPGAGAAPTARRAPGPRPGRRRGAGGGPSPAAARGRTGTRSCSTPSASSTAIAIRWWPAEDMCSRSTSHSRGSRYSRSRQKSTTVAPWVSATSRTSSL